MGSIDHVDTTDNGGIHMPKGMEMGMDHGGVRVHSTTLVSNQLRTEELLVSRMS